MVTNARHHRDRRIRLHHLVVAVGVLLVAACSESATGPEEEETESMLTVDARLTRAYVKLGTTASTVAVSDSSTSSAWDLGFYSTSVVINGQGVGPGGMTVHCICQNAGATNDQVVNMTPASELADFDAVTAAQIPPPGAAWSATAIADNPWYRYDLLGNHFIHPTFNVYLVKRGSEVYKIQIINYYNPAIESRWVTFRYERLTGS